MEKEKLVQFIQQIMPMSLEKAEQITQYFTPKQFSKNDYLLKEGKICTKSYFIGIEGHEVTTEFYSKNIFANDFLSFFKRIPSKENFQALTDCKTWEIGYDDLQICFHTLPEFREFGRMMLINNYSRLKERVLRLKH